LSISYLVQEEKYVFVSRFFGRHLITAPSEIVTAVCLSWAGSIFCVIQLQRYAHLWTVSDSVPISSSPSCPLSLFAQHLQSSDTVGLICWEAKRSQSKKNWRFEENLERTTIQDFCNMVSGTEAATESRILKRVSCNRNQSRHKTNLPNVENNGNYSINLQNVNLITWPQFNLHISVHIITPFTSIIIWSLFQIAFI
jgi:hypothetical protein